MRTFLYIGSFGLRLPWFPIYAESPHSRVNIRNIRKTITMCRRLKESLIKQMLIYVCCLSVFLCHRRWLVVFILLCIIIGQDWPIDCSIFYVSERGRSLKLRLRATHGCAVQWHYVLFYALPPATLQVTSGTL